MARQICTFFGHRDAPDALSGALSAAIAAQLRQNRQTDFYIGSDGNFDRLARLTLRPLLHQYPDAHLYRILAYLPPSRAAADGDALLYPEGLERVPRRFAIAHRNRWMAQQADCVIGYVCRPFGGAYTAFRYAARLGRDCVNLAEPGAPLLPNRAELEYAKGQQTN